MVRHFAAATSCLVPAQVYPMPLCIKCAQGPRSLQAFCCSLWLTDDCYTAAHCTGPVIHRLDYVSLCVASYRLGSARTGPIPHAWFVRNRASPRCPKSIASHTERRSPAIVRLAAKLFLSLTHLLWRWRESVIE